MQLFNIYISCLIEWSWICRDDGVDGSGQISCVGLTELTVYGHSPVLVDGSHGGVLICGRMRWLSR